MANNNIYMFVSGFYHKKPDVDPFLNGDVHLRVTRGSNFDHPIDITTFHGNMTIPSSCKAKKISLTRDQVRQLIDSLQDALKTIE